MRGRTEERKRAVRTVPGALELLEIVPKIPEAWKQEAEHLEPPFWGQIKVFPPFKRFWIENKIYPAVVTFGLRTKWGFKTLFFKPVSYSLYYASGTVPIGGTISIGSVTGTVEIENIRVGLLLDPALADISYLDIYFQLYINDVEAYRITPYAVVWAGDALVRYPHMEFVTWDVEHKWLIVDYKNPLFVTDKFEVRIINNLLSDINYAISLKATTFSLDEKPLVEGFVSTGTGGVVW